MPTEITQHFNPKLSYPFYFMRKALFNALEENAPALSGVMMDFGCGSKPYKSLFKVEKYIGVDYAGEGHSHETEHIDVYYDGKTIPFCDNHFDSILCTEVFEHLFDIEILLKELHRVLKPGGKMLVTCPFVWNEHEAPIDYARYTQYALRHLFEKNQFKVVKQDKKGTFVETLTQLSNLYVLETLFGSYNLKHYMAKRYINRLQPLFITLNNAIGSGLNKILPKRYDIYLSNVFVVEKHIH
jgi:SAM-dependent methyltransferase